MESDNIENRIGLIKYPRGSEWSRWDLHIHTPFSIVQDYGGNTKENWERFITEIENLPPDVKVIGINDYIFIDGYQKVLKFKKNGRLNKIDLILPIIELRIDEFCGSGDELRKVNIHIIFDEKANIKPDQIQNQFISGLCSEYKLDQLDRKEWSMSPTIESLCELGQKIKSVTQRDKPVHNISDLRVGFNNLFFSRDNIFGLLKKSPFKDHYLIGLGFAEWDQIRWDQATSVKRDIANRSAFFFTSGSDDEAVVRHRNKLRQDGFYHPIIHGSDAHDNSNIGKSRTWIKADPTFEGLKQIVYEPDERVFIGETLPKEKNNAVIIDKIEINNSNDWFEETPQLLNEGLVTIVGEKGAGKTALAELIALASGGFEISEENPGSFVRKALKATKQITKTIEGCTATVFWKDATSDSITITSSFDNYVNSGKVRYLSQSFIEKKCHPDYADELQKEVENIIFQHISVEERMGQTAFADLRKLKTRGIEVRKNQSKKNLLELNHEIYTLETEIGSLEEKRQEKVRLQEEINQLEGQKPKPRTLEEEVLEKKISLLKNRKTVLTDSIANYKKQLSTVDSIGTQVETLSAYVDDQLVKLKEDFEAIGLADLHKKLFLTIPDDFATRLEEKRAEFKKQIQTLQGILDQNSKSKDENKAYDQKADITKLTEEIIGKFTLKETIQIIALLEAKSSLAEEQRRIIREFDKKISRNKKRIEELEKAISDIDQIKKPLLPQKIEERESAYRSFIALLQEEKKVLEEIYAQLKNKLVKEGEGEENQLEFFARIEFDIDSYFSKAREVIDFRRGRYHHGEEALLKEIKSMADKIELFEISDVFALLDEFYKTFERDENSEPLKINQQLSKKKANLDFYNWIFDVSDYKVAYGIRFQGTNIELLSPGKKGIVLLLMYLALDTESSVPLLIDQPEENLDNKSVYAHLIEYFRRAKKRRQIIIITHNPNLVLNTDAEQVIVANFEANPNVYSSRITYLSGSIENSFVNKAAGIPLREQGIREHGLDILEGGKNAFVKRGQKWNLRT